MTTLLHKFSALKPERVCDVALEQSNELQVCRIGSTTKENFPPAGKNCLGRSTVLASIDSRLYESIQVVFAAGWQRRCNPRPCIPARWGGKVNGSDCGYFRKAAGWVSNLGRSCRQFVLGARPSQRTQQDSAVRLFHL